MNNKLTTQNDEQFSIIYNMINDTRLKFWQQANKSIVELYFSVGEFLSKHVSDRGWRQQTVTYLSEFIASREPDIKGFSARNLWRMKQFYDYYHFYPELVKLLPKITWTNHLHIMSKTKTTEEKEFYLRLAAKHFYSERNLAKIIDSGTFERTMLAKDNTAKVLAAFPVDTHNIFKDSYVFDFVDLPDKYKEHDLRKALVNNLKNFLLELGPDFSLLGEEYIVSVGMKDFKIDLLMHNRRLNALVAIELKTTEFQPEHLGKLQFYLEALDKEIKQPHENPSIGILICKTKDQEIVKYALNRSMSPTMIAEYETKLISKDILTKKLHELSEALNNIDDEDL